MHGDDRTDAGHQVRELPFNFFWYLYIKWYGRLLAAFIVVLCIQYWRPSPQFSYWLVLSLLAVGAVAVQWWIHRLARLARLGVEVEATVVKLWKYQKHGKTAITIEYEFNGQLCTGNFTGDVERYPLDTRVVILVDPRHPQKFVPKSELLKD